VALNRRIPRRSARPSLPARWGAGRRPSQCAERARALWSERACGRLGSSVGPGPLEPHSRHKLRHLERKAPRHALVDLHDDVPKFAHARRPRRARRGRECLPLKLQTIAAKKPRRPSADVSNSLSKTISRLGLLAIPLVLVNQDLSRDDAWFGRPPRDDCSRERLAFENRLIALCTDPMLTHVLPLRNQPILRPPRGRNVGCRADSEGEMDRGAAMLAKAPLSPIPQRQNGRLESRLKRR